MKRSRFSEERSIGILRQAQAGVHVVDLCRQNGISDATFYKWRAKFGGMDISDAKRPRQLEEETPGSKKWIYHCSGLAESRKHTGPRINPFIKRESLTFIGIMNGGGSIGTGQFQERALLSGMMAFHDKDPLPL